MLMELLRHSRSLLVATVKQQQAIANVVENGGNVSKAMRDAGYSEATAKTPQKLTESKAFTDAMIEAGITDNKLATVLSEGLEATKVISAVVGKNADEKTMDFIDVPDHPTRHKFLETALKIKGVGKDDTPLGTIIFNKGDLVQKKYVKD